MRLLVLSLMVALFGAGTAPGQELTALARLDPAASSVRDVGAEVVVEFTLSQPVPWRVRVLDDPPRLILDAREVDWSGLAGVSETSEAVAEMRAGPLRPGWSRLVLRLAGPMLAHTAGMSTQGPVRLTLHLAPADPAAFSERAALPEPQDWALPEPVALPAAPTRDDGPLRVVLDPGHGGIDPGAEHEGAREADLMLLFAREVKEALLRAGGFEVVLTREEDIFVPLEERLTIARGAGADVFLSLHADALAAGEAEGTALYTLSADAGDAAARALAERHDRDDLLAGIDLSQQDDLVATVLMDMARTETAPRIRRLAAALEAAMLGAGVRMHPRPRQEGGFSVLKSPDIPSVLIEMGFLSSAADRERLYDETWRARLAGAILTGLAEWRDEDRLISAAGQE